MAHHAGKPLPNDGRPTRSSVEQDNTDTILRQYFSLLHAPTVRTYVMTSDTWTEEKQNSAKSAATYCICTESSGTHERVLHQS